MVSAGPPGYNFSSPLTKHLGTDPSAPIIIGITVTFMFYYFFSSMVRSKYLSFFSFSLAFTLVCHLSKLFVFLFVFFGFHSGLPSQQSICLSFRFHWFSLWSVISAKYLSFFSFSLVFTLVRHLSKVFVFLFVFFGVHSSAKFTITQVLFFSFPPAFFFFFFVN